MASPDGKKRFLIAIGVNEYADEEFESLPEVARDLEMIVSIFVGRLGYEQVLLGLASNPTAREMRRRLSQWFSNARRAHDDIVLVYFAGHGFTSASNQHYLCTRDFTARNPSDTGVRTADLVNLFWEGEGPRPQNVWVVADTCYSGQGTGGMLEQIGRTTQQIFAAQRGGFWALAAGRAIDEAHDGKFAQAFTEVIDERLTDPAFGAASQEAFGTDGIAAGINERLHKWELGQVAQLGSAGVSGNFPFLPNPRYRPGAAGLDLEAQEQLETRADLRAHWIPKAQGTELGEPGWFFSGRHSALAELVMWLNAPESDARARVVTGDPGSGKSAVLGRLVTLAHKSTRQTMKEKGLLEGIDPAALPTVGSIDLAMHVRGKSLKQVQGLIATALGEERDRLGAALEALTQRKTLFRVVVDALDESPEGALIVREVLRPLTAYAAVRLIVGTRRPLVALFGANRIVLDLDLPAYLATEDLAEYVANRLADGLFAGRRSPYHKKVATTRAVADVVAMVAHPSFLIARLICTQLARADAPIDVTAKGWEVRLRGGLPATLPEAYDVDLERFGDRTQRVKDVLRPLAYARGLGLPWERIWEAVASEISGRPYARSDIEEVRRDAAFFIVEDREAGVSVYRLFHESFAEYLRLPGETKEIERRIAAALTATVARGASDAPGWLAETRPYLRTHLAEHAAAAGTLASLTADPAFLAVANADALLPLMRGADSAVPTPLRRLYSRAVHHVRRNRAADALSYLELAARKSGSALLDKQLAVRADEQNWSVPWVRWLAEVPHRVIQTGDSSTTAVATLIMDERPILLTGSREGVLRLFDLETGAPVAAPMQCEGRVWAFLTGGEGAPPTIAAIHGGSGTRRNLTLWNLSTRKATPTDQTLIGYRVGLLRGKPALLTLHQRREARWLAIEAGVIVSRPATDVGEKPDMRWAKLYPKLRYFCDSGGEEIALLQPETKGLSVVRLRTGRKIGKDFTRVATSPFSAPAVLDANPDGARLWVPSGRDIEALPLTATGGPRTTLRGSRAAVGQLALLEWRGTQSLASIDAENVRVWDLRDTDLEQHAHAWRHGRPDALFAITQKGRTTLVVSAGEKTILSDAHDGTELRVIDHQGFSGSGLSVGRLGAMNVLVAADATGVVRLFDCDSGDAIGKPMRHDNEGDDDVSVAGFARLDGRDLLITVSSYGRNIVTLWDPTRGTRVLGPLKLPAESVDDAIGTQLDDRLVVVCHDDEARSLRIWDPVTQKAIGRRVRVAEHTHFLSSGMVAGRAVVLALEGESKGERRVVGWAVSDRAPAFAPIRLNKPGGVCLTAGTLNGGAVIAIGYVASLQLWSLDGRCLLDVEVDARVSAIELVAPRRVIAATSKGLLAIDRRA